MGTEIKIPTQRVETIVSGNFSEKGNFSGLNSAGERFFIGKKLMEDFGIVKQADFKEPFQSIVTVNTYNELWNEEDVVAGKATEDQVGQVKTYKDSEGETHNITFDRVNATGLFKTFKDAHIALNGNAFELAKLTIEQDNELAQLRLNGKVSLNKIAKENDLSAEMMKMLTSAL